MSSDASTLRRAAEPGPPLARGIQVSETTASLAAEGGWNAKDDEAEDVEDFEDVEE
jgi:hypothetical protein